MPLEGIEVEGMSRLPHCSRWFPFLDPFGKAGLSQKQRYSRHSKIRRYATEARSDRSMKDGQVRNWASFRIAKTGQLRIPVFPCRLGNFGKIDLGTDFEKTASNISAFQGVELGFHARFS